MEALLRTYIQQTHHLTFIFCGSKKHMMGTPSVSRRIAEALCEKGLLNDDVTLEGTIYSLNDVFFSHWMERL